MPRAYTPSVFPVYNSLMPFDTTMEERGSPDGFTDSPHDLVTCEFMEEITWRDECGPNFLIRLPFLLMASNT
jgi:hypothetical protein